MSSRKRSSSKKRSDRSSKRSEAGFPEEHPINPALHLAEISRPLLELFSVVDDVFSEPDAFSDEKIKTSTGRIYREWKRIRKELDPDFDQHKYSHKKKAKIFE